jgi:PAS domain S-box-containing protein
MEKEAETKKELIEDVADLRQQPADVKKSRSETKNSLQALQASETRYRRLFETAQDGILILNAETGQIDDVNPYMIDMLHYSLDEFVGMRIWDVSPFKDTVFNKEAFEELQDKGYIRYKDLPLETKEGEPIAVEFVSNVYKVNGDKVIQCNIRNITERKQIEETLRKSERELKSKTENLEEVNSALNVLLKRVEEGRIELEEKILSNIRELVLPYIDRLKKTQLSDHQASYLIVIETHLDNIVSSFLYHLKMRYLNLTHREVQVASLVKEGKSNKEIAELLNIAIKTVLFHRNSLRNKLGLKTQKANLRAHLLTFT